MKTAIPPTKKVSKDALLTIRIDPRQKKFWEESIEKLGANDLSSYIRRAVDRSIGQDIRSLDPKWQAFLEAVQNSANKFLGHGLSDDLKSRISSVNLSHKKNS